MDILNSIKYFASAGTALSLNLASTESIFNIATVIVLGYILGSISFSYIIFKKKTGKDIRTVGSGNAGASNIRRFLGGKYYVLVLLLDILKGIVAVLIALFFTNDITVASITGGAAIMGHSYPVFLGFRGGKSVAVTLGVFIPLNIWSVLIFAFVYFSLVYMTKIVSIASLTASFWLVAATFIFSAPLPVSLLAVFSLVLILWRHRSNILRLIRGEENTATKVKSNDGGEE